MNSSTISYILYFIFELYVAPKMKEKFNIVNFVVDDSNLQKNNN